MTTNRSPVMDLNRKMTKEIQANRPVNRHRSGTKKSKSSIIKQIIYATLLRIFLIIYGTWHDGNFQLKYTDIDYNVFSDAAKLVTEGKSPYLRPTYRYSPLLAWILTLNTYLHSVCGKIIFITCDIITGYLIYCLHNIYGTSKRWNHISTFVWLFNPLTLIISTRGSADSLMTCLVLSTLYFLQTKNHKLAGFLFGLSIHVRIYPLTYCLPFYLSLQILRGNKSTLWNLFYPNLQRIKFTLVTVLTLVTCTLFGYFCYGELFVNESYFYHIFRKDVQHNFSPYFYMLYLTSDFDVPFLNLITFLPQFLLLLIIGLKFYEKQNLPLCLFAQTFVFVSLNKVCTSQYFLWYVGLIPFIIPKLNMTTKQICTCVLLWLMFQCVWLIFAYFLEFKGLNTFFYLWIAGLAFYLGNVYILSEIIKNYNVNSCKKLV